MDLNTAIPTLGNSSSGGSTFSTGSSVLQKYNSLDHKVEIFLDNSGNFDGAPQHRYKINPAAILNLTIDENLTNWVVEGTMSFLYLPDDIPPLEGGKSGGNPAQTTLVGAAVENGQMLTSYQFRGDGMDMLRIMIVPKASPNSQQDGEAISDALQIDENDPKWILSYMFSVVEVEDVNQLPELQGPAAPYMKCVKLYFHDVRYQMLKSSNIEYSTANSPNASWGTGCSNDGVLKTGSAIMEILNQTLANPEEGGCMAFMQSEDEETWDVGSTELFYTSPAGWSAADDIDYLFDHHLSKNDLANSVPPSNGIPLKEICILSVDRPQSQNDVGKLTLEPLSTLFKQSTEGDQPGPLQLEHFFVTAQTKNKDTVSSPGAPVPGNTYKAPVGDGPDRDLKTFKYGQIISYSMVDMSPLINAHMFSTTPVYSVDIGKRKFTVKFQDNDVSTARRLLAETYITALHPQSSPDEKLFLPTIHRTKEKRNIFPVFTLNGDKDPGGKGEILRQKNGLGQLMYTGIFQNACICFKTFGLTLRQAGSFIGIDKTEGSDNSDFSNKLYGQWFVVKVEHCFEAGAYMNNIYAIKIRRFEPQTYQFPSTI